MDPIQQLLAFLMLFTMALAQLIPLGGFRPPTFSRNNAAYCVGPSLKTTLIALCAPNQEIMFQDCSELLDQMQPAGRKMGAVCVQPRKGKGNAGCYWNGQLHSPTLFDDAPATTGTASKFKRSISPSENIEMDGETDEFAALKNFWCVNLANSDLTHVYSVSPRAAVATPCPQALAEVETNVVPDFPPRGLNMSGIASHTSHRSSSTSSASSIHHTSKAAATAKKTSSSHHNHASTTAAAATAAAATSAAGKKSTKTVTHTEKHRHAHTTTRGHRSTGTPAPNMSVRYDAGLGFVGVALSTVAALFVMMF